MSRQKRNIRLTIIGDNVRRLALLRQEISRYDASCERQTLDAAQASLGKPATQGQSAFEAADVLLVDFAGPETARLSLVHALAFGRKRALTPVVIMTSEESERLLRNSTGKKDKPTMFTPTPFSAFMTGLLQEKRRRLVKALNTLYQFGPILVRLPSSAIPDITEHTALSA